MVDFIEASPLRYALTFKPTIHVSHIRQFWSTARIETTDEGTHILAIVDGTPIEPHHTPSPEAQPSSHTYISSPSLPTIITISTAPIPTVTPSETTPLRQYTQRARIAQSSALPLVADEHASPVRDVSQGEACPTKSGFIADQDRTTIAKSSTLPYDSATRVTSPAAIEGTEGSGDDAPIKGRRLDEEEVATERVSSDTEEIRLDEGEVATKKVVPTAAAVTPANVSISTGSGVVPTASTTISTARPIFATATTVTPYTRRKGKEKMVETHTPKKKKRVQEQIDIKGSSKDECSNCQR
nr:hypothetical protein [Tanacetum cinerariifolium]